MSENVTAEGLTLALALTAAGAAVFAALIMGIVEVVSRLVPQIKGHEQLLAAALALIVVVAAMGSAVQTETLVLSIDSIFAGVIAWYGITRVAMGIHDDLFRRDDPGALGNRV